MYEISQKTVFFLDLLSKIVTCFSAMTNGRKLLTVSNDKQDLTPLHGIRFLSMAWIMLGHTFFFGFALTCNSTVIMALPRILRIGGSER